jgi:diaminopimelate decarboxylase
MQLAQDQAKLFFACKANPLGAVLSTLNEAGICFDVSSTGELQQVLSLGIPGNRIIMTGPAKPEKLIRQALANRVSTFVVESSNQLELLQILAQSYSYEPNILLRLQLQWQDNEQSVLGGNQITPFGMDLNTARTLLPKIKLPLLGFHVFQWGNILSVDKLRQVWKNTAAACQNLTKDFKVLDVGGGLGIPYTSSLTRCSNFCLQ